MKKTFKEYTTGGSNNGGLGTNIVGAGISVVGLGA